MTCRVQFDDSSKAGDWLEGDLVLCEAVCARVTNAMVGATHFMPFIASDGRILVKRHFQNGDIVVLPVADRSVDDRVYGVLDSRLPMFVNANGSPLSAAKWWLECRAPTPAEAESYAAQQVQKHMAALRAQVEREALEKKQSSVNESIDAVLTSLVECEHARPKMLNAVVQSLSHAELLDAMKKIVARLSAASN